MCKNDLQEITQDNFEVKQLPSVCNLALKSLKPVDKTIEYDSSTKLAFKTDSELIVNTMQSNCDLKECSLKKIGCKDKYLETNLELINRDIYLSSTAVKDGQILSFCLECTNHVQTLQQNNLLVVQTPSDPLGFSPFLVIQDKVNYTLTIPKDFEFKGYTSWPIS